MHEVATHELWTQHKYQQETTIHFLFYYSSFEGWGCHQVYRTRSYLDTGGRQERLGPTYVTELDVSVNLGRWTSRLHAGDAIARTYR